MLAQFFQSLRRRGVYVAAGALLVFNACEGATENALRGDAGAVDAAQEIIQGQVLQGRSLSTSPSTYNVGAAKSDITGPFVQSSTGYNSPGDEMSGLAMRLYSRAFVIEQPGTGMVALVSADQLHMYQSVKVGVVKRLATLGYGSLFDTENVMLTATHTHAATSNISWYTLFNLFNGVTGFDELHYEVVVRGITQSIIDAYNNRQAASIQYASGTVSNAAYNRSSIAYDQNSDAGSFSDNVDAEMTLLRFDALDGTEIGLINWFAVHGTSLDIANRRIHGDNKGYASYKIEKMKGGNFVAAFAQGAMGDVSPNIPNPTDITLPFLRPSDLDASLDAQENPIVAGERQAVAALQLYNAANTSVPVALDVRHSHVNFNDVDVANSYISTNYMPWDNEINSATAASCVGVVGAGFLAGDEEGAPVEFAAEGEIKNTYSYENGQWVQTKYDFNDLDGDGIAAFLGPLWPLAAAVLQTNQYDQCHKEKFALLPVGEVDDFWFPNPNTPFVPVVIPLQIIRIGDIGVLGTPFEVTTMTGRRLKDAVSANLANAGVANLVLAGMANSYGQYLTTREEYAAQHFEGAFTIYGPFAEAAVAQELDRLAGHLAANTPADPGPNPPDLSTMQLIETWVSSNGVVTDGGNFGNAVQDAAASYSKDHDTVSVRFQAAHPRTVLVKKMDGSLSQYYDPDSYTFLEVQKKVGSDWQTIATDGDPYTAFDWERNGGSSSLSDQSFATATWLVRNQQPGTYRIRYNGLAKRWYFFWTGYEKFTGYSREFVLQ